jgi:hypothetical protein
VAAGVWLPGVAVVATVQEAVTEAGCMAMASGDNGRDSEHSEARSEVRSTISRSKRGCLLGLDFFNSVS